MVKCCLVLALERVGPAAADAVGDRTHCGVDADAGWAVWVVGFDVEVSEPVVDESGQGVVELAAVAAVADAEVGGEFVDAMDAPLVVAIVVDVVEEAGCGRAELGEPPAAPVGVAERDVEFVRVRVGGKADCDVLVLHG